MSVGAGNRSPTMGAEFEVLIISVSHMPRPNVATRSFPAQWLKSISVTTIGGMPSLKQYHCTEGFTFSLLRGALGLNVLKSQVNTPTSVPANNLLSPS